MISLTSCSLFNRQEPPTQIVTERVFVYPPDRYTVPCEAVRPEDPTLKAIMAAQRATILKCNTQLRLIREWKDQHEYEQ